MLVLLGDLVRYLIVWVLCGTVPPDGTRSAVMRLGIEWSTYEGMIVLVRGLV